MPITLDRIVDICPKLWYTKSISWRNTANGYFWSFSDIKQNKRRLLQVPVSYTVRAATWSMRAVTALTYPRNFGTASCLRHFEWRQKDHHVSPFWAWYLPWHYGKIRTACQLHEWSHGKPVFGCDVADPQNHVEVLWQTPHWFSLKRSQYRRIEYPQTHPGRSEIIREILARSSHGCSHTSQIKVWSNFQEVR